MQIELFTVENVKNCIKYSRDWIDKMIKRNNELYFQPVNYLPLDIKRQRNSFFPLSHAHCNE